MPIQDDAIEPAAPRNPEYEQLLAVKRDTAHAGPALAKQLKLVDDLEAQLHDCNCSLIQLDANCKSKLEEHQKYRDGNVRRIMYRVTGNKDKFDKRANEGKQEYESIHKKLQDEHNRNANLKEQVKDAIQARDELHSLSMMHDSAQSQLEYIDLGFLPINAGDGFPEAGADAIEAFSTIDMFLEQLGSGDECLTAPSSVEKSWEMDEYIRSL